MQARILYAHAIFDTSVIEQVPAHTWPHCQLCCFAQDVEAVVAPAEYSEQRYGGVQISLRNAHLSGLGRGLPCGGANIRPAQQKLRRDGGQGAWLQHGQLAVHRRELRHIAGRATQQRAQCVAGLGEGELQAGNGCQGRKILRLCLLQVELGILPPFKSPLGNLVAAFLQGHVTFSDFDALQGCLVVEVQCGELRSEQYLRITLRGDGGEVGGVRRLDATPETPPEIQLPAQIEGEFAAAQVPCVPASPMLVDPRRIATDCLHLRVAQAGRDARERAALQNAQAGDAQ